MKAPEGSYFITGRPRSRTAWLAALFYGEVPCFHDDLERLDDLVASGKPFGFSSPSLTAVDPKRALAIFHDTPIIVVERAAQESRRALSAWIRMPLPRWNFIEENYQRFLIAAPRDKLTCVHVQSLNRFDVVDRIHRICTGKPLCRDRFETFNLLRIEQHLEKVAARTLASWRAQSWH